MICTPHAVPALRRPLARAAAPLAAALLLALGQGASLAHHAFSAEFDAQQPITLEGVVTKGKWVNPHSWLYLDVKGADGQVTNWGVEFGAPFALQEMGLTKAVVPPGTHVQIKGYRSKNGGPFGYAVQVKLDDGRSFQPGGAQDAPTPVAAPAQR